MGVFRGRHLPAVSCHLPTLGNTLCVSTFGQLWPTISLSFYEFFFGDVLPVLLYVFFWQSRVPHEVISALSSPLASLVLSFSLFFFNASLVS